MSTKVNISILSNLSALEVFKMLLKGDIEKIPDTFWQRRNMEQNAVEVIEYLMEDILAWSNNDIRQKLSKEVFVRYGLRKMISFVFDGSTFKAINSVYPDIFKPCEFITSKIIKPKYPEPFKVHHEIFDHWTIENGVEAIKWTIENELKYNDDDVRENISKEFFMKNGLFKMLQSVFNGSPYKAINTAYPNKFKTWEFNSVPNGYWTLETGIKATKWLIEDKLQYNDEDIKNNFSRKLFVENRLTGLLQKVFANSAFNSINSVYPDKFKLWEFKSISIPKSYWTLETGIEATKWLVEEKLNLSKHGIKGNISAKIFVKNGLSAMLKTVFSYSYKKALKATYPKLEI